MEEIAGEPAEGATEEPRSETNQDLGVSEFVMQVPSLVNGNLNELELFSEKVMPSFRKK